MPLDESRGLRSSPVPPAGSPRLRERLRDAVGPLHDALDRSLGFLLEPGLDRRRYRDVLAAFYGVYAPLEDRLTALRAVSPPLPVPWVARTRLLADDLRALGLAEDELASLPRCEHGLPTGVGPLAGCLYVLEGASLGGLVITRAVRDALGVGVGAGASFFTGEGPATAARWRQVLGWLEALAAGGVSVDEMTRGACATFVAFQRWLEVRGVVP